MSILENMEGVAQSISVNHYEKYLDEAFIQMIRQDVMHFKALPTARKILLKFAVDCLNTTQSYILDIARQQHQTSELSMSSIALRNTLIYFLSEQTVQISRYLHYQNSDLEENILLYEHFPKLLASLQMLDKKSGILPCFLQTQDMEVLYNDSIRPQLVVIEEPDCLPGVVIPLTVDDILNDPHDKKEYNIVAKNGESIHGTIRALHGTSSAGIIEFVDQTNRVFPIEAQHISRISLITKPPYFEFTKEEIKNMSWLSVAHTLYGLLSMHTIRKFTDDEFEAIYSIAKEKELASLLIDTLTKSLRKG